MALAEEALAEVSGRGDTLDELCHRWAIKAEAELIGCTRADIQRGFRGKRIKVRRLRWPGPKDNRSGWPTPQARSSMWLAAKVS